jgi:ADP-ribose pyrophosphatase YjhB (NUDIX family)
VSALDRPAVGVGAVLIHQGKVLLIRRGKEPLRGLVVRPLEVVAVFDRIEREGDAVRYHYVIVDYLCEYLSGTPQAASDAEDVAFVAREDLPRYRLPEKALEVVLDGFGRAQRAAAQGLAKGPERE